MRLNFIPAAIFAALALSAPATAQERDPSKAKQPFGSAPEVVQSIPVLAGETCTGAGGTNCPSSSFSTSVTSTFEAEGCGEGGVINNVSVGLDISHTWVGDIRLTLTAPDATSVRILDQPGTPFTGDSGGCSGNDIYAILDDEGSPAAEDVCYGSAPAIAGTLSPNNPLNAFNNQSGAGTWSLLAEDFFTPLDDGVVNDWSLDFTCGDTAGSRATFRVTKDFTDDNPGEVNVSIDCNTGIILDQDKLISEGEFVEFVVTDFTDGTLNCSITEDVPAGYSAEYSGNGSGNDGECTFTEVGFGYAHDCEIVNTPEPVTFTVNKTWLYPASSAPTDEGYELYFYCDTVIQGGYGDGSDWYYDAYGLEGDGETSITVHPTWEGNTCWVSEYSYSDFVEQDTSDCQNVAIELGSDSSCELVNTVFYEGIPTLSQYGLAILALSMLGLGMVGFRRFS